MKISKRISNGWSLALSGFCQVYDNANHLLAVVLFTALVGVPTFVLIMHFIVSGFVNISFLTQISSLTGFSITSLIDKSFPISVTAMLALPFIGFLYTGIIKGINSKKRLELGELISAGFAPLKNINFLVITFILSVAILEVFSMVNIGNMPLAFDVIWSKNISLELAFAILLVFVVSLSMVSFLSMKKRGIIEALMCGASCFINSFLEIFVGFFTWLFFSIVGFMLLSGFFAYVSSIMGRSQLFSNAKFVMDPSLQALWILVAAVAWVIFIHDISKSTAK